jgi:hypothetical protein
VSEAPLRDVVRAFESTGPKGGREIVHVLSCGCWVINRRRVPAKKLRCISCRVREEQGGGPHHGVPRVEDIAWQAFQAGIRWGDSADATEALKAIDPFKDNPERALAKAENDAFREWWARR